ncbi:MAG: sulfatase [Planctomycetota bacterium]
MSALPYLHTGPPGRWPLGRSTGAFAAAVAVVALLATGCGRDGADPPAGPRPLPRLAIEGPEGASSLQIVGSDERSAVALAPGASARIEVTDPGDGLEPGDLVRIDVIAVAPEGADQAAAAATLRLQGADLEIEATGAWRTVAIDAGGMTASGLVLRAAEDADAQRILVGAPRVARPGASQPTVVLFTSDTHRADHVSAFAPRSPVVTPHLDRMAGDGALFANCYTAANVTNPSHISLMTGVHPRDTKIIDNSTRLAGSARTLAATFRDAGYQTFAAMSAFHLSDQISGLGVGFDRLNVVRGLVRDGEDTLAIATDWLDDAEGAPLFLWIHLFDAHTPYELSEEATAELVATHGSDPYSPDSSLGLEGEYYMPWLKESRVTDPSFIDRLYAGEVEYLDGALGPFLDRPRIRDAAIAFTSDHGEALGERDSWWGHFGLQRATLHVPLILRGPGVPAGSRSEGAARQIDVGRTLLDMAGLEDAAFPGRDLRADLAEERPIEPRFAIASHGFAASIELDGWILELYMRSAENHLSGVPYAVGQCTLFDTRSDPKCERDLLLEEFDRAMKMRSALIAWLDAAEVTGLNSINENVPPEVEEKLRQLGYSGGYESLVKWWGPEARVPTWDTDPWNLAFQGDGDPALLARALRTETGDR